MVRRGAGKVKKRSRELERQRLEFAGFKPEEIRLLDELVLKKRKK